MTLVPILEVLVQDDHFGPEMTKIGSKNGGRRQNREKWRFFWKLGYYIPGIIDHFGPKSTKNVTFLSKIVKIDKIVIFVFFCLWNKKILAIQYPKDTKITNMPKSTKSSFLTFWAKVTFCHFFIDFVSIPQWVSLMWTVASTSHFSFFFLCLLRMLYSFGCYFDCL